MSAVVTESDVIAGVMIVAPEVHPDERGVFVETYRREWFGSRREMVQSNRAHRVHGCIVGFHYHLHQADYWCVSAGTARVVLHDLRLGSPTDGATLVLELGEAGETYDHRGVYIPPGVAHGFAALTEVTVNYLVDNYYDPADELGIAWDDPDVSADWGITAPILSTRDQGNPRRTDLDDELRPRWTLESRP